MQAWARDFYFSSAWRNCRDSYMRSVGGLCERCLKRGLFVPGVIVHHKTHLTPDNIHDERVTLDWHNLELLCRDCHGAEHLRRQRRYTIGEGGIVMTHPPLEKNRV